MAPVWRRVKPEKEPVGAGEVIDPTKKRACKNMGSLSPKGVKEHVESLQVHDLISSDLAGRVGASDGGLWLGLSNRDNDQGFFPVRIYGSRDRGFCHPLRGHVQPAGLPFPGVCGHAFGPVPPGRSDGPSGDSGGRRAPGRQDPEHDRGSAQPGCRAVVGASRRLLRLAGQGRVYRSFGH